MRNASFLRDGLRAMEHEGKPRFVLLDDGDQHCLPVVTAMLNPEAGLTFDDIDLQHVLSQHHWYVSGYKMSYEHPISEETLPLFHDAKADQTMFRIVVKGNLTRDMAVDLLESFNAAPHLPRLRGLLEPPRREHQGHAAQGPAHRHQPLLTRSAAPRGAAARSVRRRSPSGLRRRARSGRAASRRLSVRRASP